jgi:FAD/FMN-containing dehydrogenase
MILDKLEEIVGHGNVSREQATLDQYASDFSFVNRVKPGCVVRPENTEEIQKIVKLANETLTPLVPVSSGRPHFKGDTVPGIGGAVVVDLSSMKKIIRVDRKNRVAMCEPGVTFDELIPSVEKQGLRLNMPLLPRKSKSVIGSMLEREPVTMPGYHWDIADPLGCVEIIFGTGDMFRTGSAAGPGNIEEQWAVGLAQTEASGPQQASWYRLIQGAQGTMGIVTWASMRCELLPKIEEPFIVASPNLGKILELVHWLVRLRLVGQCLILNDSNMAAITAKKWPDDYWDTRAALPSWMLFFTTVGYEHLPEERVEYQVKDMMEITQRIGLKPEKTAAKTSAYELLKTIQRPSEEPYWKLRSKGACHDIFFLTIYDKLDELIGTMQDVAGAFGYPASGIGIYLQPIVQGTSCHCEFNFFYDADNPGESARVKDLSAVAIKKLAAHGAFFSRPYGETARTIINRDAATAQALLKIKAMFDPKNIMNPGKLCF